MSGRSHQTSTHKEVSQKAQQQLENGDVVETSPLWTNFGAHFCEKCGSILKHNSTVVHPLKNVLWTVIGIQSG